MTGRIVAVIVALAVIAGALPFLLISNTPDKVVHSFVAPKDEPYPVRSDWLVIHAPTGVQPKAAYPSGFPPLYVMNRPSESWTPEAAMLHRQVENGTIVDPRKLDAKWRDEMGKVIQEMFGTLSNPRMPDGAWLIDQLKLREKVSALRKDRDVKKAQAIALGKGKSADERQSLEDLESEVNSLADGIGGLERQIGILGAYVGELRLEPEWVKEGRNRFQTFCIICHGPTGAGNGEGARLQLTLPRDYRQGIFKFITTDPSVEGKRKPSRSDLRHTIFYGTDEASPMPQFGRIFTDDELQRIISYVMHLSMRGETEFEVMKRALDPRAEAISPTELRQALIEQTAAIVSLWVISARTPIVIEPDPNVTDEQKLSAAVRGHELFINPRIGCMECHPRYGRQDLFWFDSWGSIVRTRDLTEPEFCGSNKPEKLYARIYAGILGSNMPAYTHLRPTAEERAKGINKIWDLVHFTRFVSDSSDEESWQTLRDKRQLDLSVEAGPVDPPGDTPDQRHPKRTKGKK
jgi:mono/diheme cytochrome c family protein